MSLKTDIIFVKALQSNAELMKKLAQHDVYNTDITVPDVDFDNAPLPYVIVTFEGLNNEDSTKDSYEGCTDSVQIGIEVAAKTRAELADICIAIRKTIREFFENISPEDEDYNLVPLDYTFSATPVRWYEKPAFGQMLNYKCDCNPDVEEPSES